MNIYNILSFDIFNFEMLKCYKFYEGKRERCLFNVVFVKSLCRDRDLVFKFVFIVNIVMCSFKRKENFVIICLYYSIDNFDED